MAHCHRSCPQLPLGSTLGGVRVSGLPKRSTRRMYKGSRHSSERRAPNTLPAAPWPLLRPDARRPPSLRRLRRAACSRTPRGWRRAGRSLSARSRARAFPRRRRPGVGARSSSVLRPTPPPGRATACRPITYGRTSGSRPRFGDYDRSHFKIMKNMSV